MQEVNNHPDHSQAVAHPLNNGSISYTETLLPTSPPTLVSEVKTEMQNVGAQMFTCTLGELHIPQIHPAPTGVLHAVPSQVCCYCPIFRCNEL